MQVKIALFGKALVLALVRGALTMCAMWVGFPFFFCGWEKKQNKFPSNLHCPVKKLNPFLFQFITVVSFCSSVGLTLVANLFICVLRVTYISHTGVLCVPLVSYILDLS